SRSYRLVCWHHCRAGVWSLQDTFPQTAHGISNSSILPPAKPRRSPRLRRALWAPLPRTLRLPASLCLTESNRLLSGSLPREQNQWLVLPAEIRSCHLQVPSLLERPKAP